MTNLKWWTEGKRHAITNTNTFTMFLYHTNTITWRWWTGEKPLSFRLRCPFPSPPQRPFSGEDGDHHLLYDNDDVEDKNDDRDQVLQRNGSSDPEPRGHPDNPLVQGELTNTLFLFIFSLDIILMFHIFMLPLKQPDWQKFQGVDWSHIRERPAAIPVEVRENKAIRNFFIQERIVYRKEKFFDSDNIEWLLNWRDVLLKRKNETENSNKI